MKGELKVLFQLLQQQGVEEGDTLFHAFLRR